MKAGLNKLSQCLFSLRFHRIITARQKSGGFSLQLKWRLNVRLIELSHSRGQQLCKLIWTKDSFYLTKKDQLPKDWFEAPKWPLFHGLGTTICLDVVRKRFIIVDVKTEFYLWKIYLIHFYLTSSLHVQTITASIMLNVPWKEYFRKL